LQRKQATESHEEPGSVFIVKIGGLFFCPDLRVTHL
jgi:hypothetical protein